MSTPENPDNTNPDTPPRSIPTSTDPDAQNQENSSIQEPPLKRIKIDAPQIPHYNSHNIYSRPPTVPSTVPIPSLPNILDPVSPLLFDQDQIPMDQDSNHNNNPSYAQNASLSTNGPLPPPTEQWPLCAFCHKSGDLSRCSSCRQAYYCNRECQVAHWEVHCIVCHPGPPQPPSLPKGGQKVQPPTTVTTYSHHMTSPRGSRSGYQQQSNGYSAQRKNGHVVRRRSYDVGDNMNKEQYYCEECDRYFKNGQALGGHRSRVHSTRRNGGADDGVHGGSGSTKKRRRPRPSRARHEPTGSGQYVCPHCGREFASGNALGGHISGAHTKKSRRIAQQQQAAYEHARYARPRHPNI